MKKLFSSLLIAGLLAGTTHAQVILSVDFNLSGNANSLTETSFESFSLAIPGGTLDPSQVYDSDLGDLTVTVFGSATILGGRYRSNLPDSGAFTYGDLLEDLLTNFNKNMTTGGGTPGTQAPTVNSFSISGLEANTDYLLQIWTLDTQYNNGAITGWWDTTNGTGEDATLLGNVIVNVTSPALISNNDFSTIGVIRSDASGVIQLGSVMSAGTGSLNGFQLSAIPEPSAMTLLIGSLGALLVLRRRRRARA